MKSSLILLLLSAVVKTGGDPVDPKYAMYLANRGIDVYNSHHKRIRLGIPLKIISSRSATAPPSVMIQTLYYVTFLASVDVCFVAKVPEYESQYPRVHCPKNMTCSMIAEKGVSPEGKKYFAPGKETDCSPNGPPA